MGRIYAFANQKGGVGKTTTAVNLSACLAQAGCRVLLVDADPQANATSSLGAEPNGLRTSLYDVLIRRHPAVDNVIPTTHDGLDLLPSAPALAGAEVEMVSVLAREYLLRRALEPLAGRYTHILIDCPPSLGLLTVNALSAAADGVIVPIQCEYLALEGLGRLWHTVQMVRESLNPQLFITGMVLTMYDPRTNLSDQVVAEVRNHFPRPDVPDGHPAQRAVERGAELRQDDLAVRAAIGGRARLHGPGARAAGARGDRASCGRERGGARGEAMSAQARGLGKGLGALIPTGGAEAAARGGRRAAGRPGQRHHPQPPPAAHRMDAGFAGRACRLDQGTRADPAADRHPRRAGGPRALPADRGRAALAGGPDGRAADRAGPAQGSHAAAVPRTGAGREHPAGGPEPAGRGGGVPGADEPISA